MLCLGKNKDGSDCERRGTRSSGYCTWHNPDKSTRLDAIDEKEAVARTEKQQPSRDTEYKTLTDICDMVRGVTDLESLKQAELYVAAGLIGGTIDPKAGGAVSQLLKHQADLILKTKPKDDTLDETGRKVAITISANMPAEEAWNLMQDFTAGFQKLQSSILNAPIDVESTEVKSITMESGSDNKTESVGSEREPGIQEASGDAEEIF